MRKHLILLLLFAFLAPANADVTYQSPNLGFSIKHPDNWTVRRHRRIPFVVTFPSTRVEDPATENFHVNVTRLSGNGGSGTWSMMQRTQLEGRYPDMKLTKSKQLKLKKFADAQRFEFKGKVRSKRMNLTYVLIFEENKMYELSFLANEKDYKRLSYKVDQMIKSFKTDS